MAKKISFNLSVASIRAAQQEIQKYQQDLTRKCEILCRRLTEEGIRVAQAHIDESPLGKTITLRSEITPEQAGCKAILFAVGQIKESDGFAPFNTLLAVEFGAGIYHNKKQNPKAGEFGMGIGTFPGQIHAFEDGWYYWSEKTKRWEFTHGVKATMPMYYAGKEMRAKIVSIAREVFG